MMEYQKKQQAICLIAETLSPMAIYEVIEALEVIRIFKDADLYEERTQDYIHNMNAEECDRHQGENQ